MSCLAVNHFWIIMILLSMCFMSYGQIYDSDILSRRICQRMSDINDNISLAGDKKKDLSTRKYYMNRVLSMLHNRGGNYMNPSDSIEKAINITYNIYGKERSHNVKNYLLGVLNLRYQPIQINSLNILSLCNVDFSRDTYIESPKTFDISKLKRHNSGYYILPCTVLYKNTNKRIETELYLLEENTIDGIELIPLITGLNGNMENIIINQQDSIKRIK